MSEALPELPHSPMLYSYWTSPTETAAQTLYTADQMREYARQAVLAEREACALIAETTRCGPYPTCGQYAAHLRPAIAAAIRAGTER